MATITTDTFLDGGVARTAAEAWACNGGILTIRTDTRWHADAPAAMAGVLGSVTISSSLGGGLYIDGTKVRWMPYDSGTGNVPAIGATIIQGGVSGYLLGVWSSTTSAPTAVGAAMPANGFIKFREVTNGPFSIGALSGIGASATGPDVVGWIEVVGQQAIAITVPRLGKFQTRGDWFDLGLTSGLAGQNIQIPTNGSATAYSPGIWIETDVPDVFEFYSAIYADGITPINFGTDERSKIVLMGTDGSMTIGNNGTTDVGYVPPANRKMRIPNIFLRQCVSTTRNLNAIPHATVATRPDFTTTSAGYIDIEHTYGDWYYLFSQPYYVKMHHVATFDGINISECASSLDIKDGGAGSASGISLAGGYFTSCFAGGEISDWIFSGLSNALTGGFCSFAYCIGQRIRNCKSGTWTYARSSSKSYGFYVNQSTDIQFFDNETLNCTNYLNTSFDIVVDGHDHCDRYVGETNGTSGLYCWLVAKSCVGVKIEDVTFGKKGLIDNQHPYNGIVSCAASSDVKVRNMGTREEFLNGGTAFNPAYIFADGGNNVDVKVQRCYLQPTRTAAHSSVNSSKNVLFEDCYGDWLDTVTVAALNCIERGGSGKMTTTGQASVYGSHFGGAFMSDTWGAMWLALNEPSAETMQYCEMNFSVGSGFTSAGNLSLATVGDYFICEMQEARLQTTGFVGATPWAIGTNPQYHDYDYQIDNGSG